jgi:D-serine dehydratase
MPNPALASVPDPASTLDFTLDHRHKSYPAHRGACRASELAARGWNVLADDLAYPLAVIREDALAHNLRWMQDFAARKGVSLAPHGKTPMSPQLCARQLAAGAWGLSFATVFQTQMGVAAGARRVIIANQVLADADLEGLAALLAQTAGLRVWFLVDSLAQLAVIADWARRRHQAPPCFDVLLELGIPGQRTGCRTLGEALALARALHASPLVRLGGIECYEGGLATCDSAHDAAAVTGLVRRVNECVRVCAAEGLFEGDEVIVSAGGSAVFDLVVPMLTGHNLNKPLRGVLRSGCYVTHDHGTYARFLALVAQREQVTSSLQAALCLWALVQSVPEPGLALLTCGRRDISYDQALPTPILHAPRGARVATPAPTDWAITALNDQHAYLRFDVTVHDDLSQNAIKNVSKEMNKDLPKGVARTVQVGDRVALGISHPCTTFDKWRWMALVDENWSLTGAVSTAF